MGDWLVGDFMIFGVQAQNGMPIALAIILVLIFLFWRSRR
jgi:hypothetical protein